MTALSLVSAIRLTPLPETPLGLFLRLCHLLQDRRRRQGRCEGRRRRICRSEGRCRRSGRYRERPRVVARRRRSAALVPGPHPQAVFSISREPTESVLRDRADMSPVAVCSTLYLIICRPHRARPMERDLRLRDAARAQPCRRHRWQRQSPAFDRGRCRCASGVHRPHAEAVFRVGGEPVELILPDIATDCADLRPVAQAAALYLIAARTSRQAPVEGHAGRLKAFHREESGGGWRVGRGGEGRGGGWSLSRGMGSSRGESGCGGVGWRVSQSVSRRVSVRRRKSGRVC